MSQTEPTGTAFQVKYRLVPAISPTDYADIKSQIEQDMQVRPGLVRTDEQGNFIFGEDYAKAAIELEVECSPEVVIYGDDELLKWRDSLDARFRGCHLSSKQRQEAARLYLLKSGDTEISNRQLAKRVGIGHPLVATIRKQLEASGSILPADKRRGANGRKFPALTQRVVCDTNKQHTKLLDNIEHLPSSPRSGTLDFARAEHRMKRAKHAKDRQERIANLPPYDPDQSDKYRLHNLDFRQAPSKIKPGTVDVICIDPPYGRDWLPHWKEFAAVCCELLKPGGTLVGWAGRDNCLDAQIACRAAGLMMWPTIRQRFKAMCHRGVNSSGTSLMQCFGEPLILATKGKQNWQRSFPDEFNSAGDSGRLHHRWEKQLQDVVTVLGWFCIPGDFVVDLTAGSFTTALACKQLQLEFAGFDVEPDCIRIGVERLRQSQEKEPAQENHLPLVRPAPMNALADVSLVGSK